MHVMRRTKIVKQCLQSLPGFELGTFHSECLECNMLQTARLRSPLYNTKMFEFLILLGCYLMVPFIQYFENFTCCMLTTQACFDVFFITLCATFSLYPNLIPRKISTIAKERLNGKITKILGFFFRKKCLETFFFYIGLFQLLSLSRFQFLSCAQQFIQPCYTDIHLL